MNALNHSRSLAFFGLLLANLCWSGNALVARAFAGEIAPFTLSFWRWCLALALLLPFVAVPLWRHRAAVAKAGWRLLVLGGLGIAGYNSLLYSAAQTTAAINISLVNTCLPLVTFIGAGLLLNEWPARRAWWGMLVAVVGLAVLISQGQWSRLASLSFNQGDLIMLLAVVDWALYSLLLRRWAAYLQPIPPLALLGVFILLGVPLILPFYLYELAQGVQLALNVANLSAIAYTAVFASLLAYLAWNHGIRVVGAAKAALTNYLMPVFTALLGWVLLSESLQLYHWLGAAMIFGGLLLATRPSKA
ncbi:DMT family transporter [Ectopseudomonas hydrolytica]|uniref:DMT family transporter n=1 Tax=Ectopseudomonas hydrolytica TaxID=2493633 RepID=UPI0018A71D08|nr:DMT family transporter [Pseudomonas hydrolytica]MBF8163876.1 DMT family transporter [Pseudomonas mendocina]UTH32729.1 DMT family transporter [Pseudomonas hydrolytica]UZZ11918.1 DMT family transporter [Pseudomonas mendocina]